MLRIKGIKKMRDTLKKLATDHPQKVASAIYLEAQIIMTESKKRCPVDDGPLRTSGTVHLPEIRIAGGKKQIKVLMSYGGAAQDYALAVHEHMSEHSPWMWIVAELEGKGITWSAAGTGPKFLESAINDAMPTLAAKIAARMKL